MWTRDLARILKEEIDIRDIHGSHTWEKNTFLSNSSWFLFICFALVCNSRCRSKPLIAAGAVSVVSFERVGFTDGLKVHSFISFSSFSVLDSSLLVFSCWTNQKTCIGCPKAEKAIHKTFIHLRWKLCIWLLALSPKLCLLRWI